MIGAYYDKEKIHIQLTHNTEYRQILPEYRFYLK